MEEIKSIARRFFAEQDRRKGSLRPSRALPTTRRTLGGNPPVDLEGHNQMARYPLLAAFQGRRSRRLGLGMEIPGGPFAYRSRHAPLPLDEAEEAALAFAACGLTGYALADLSYGASQGGSMLAGLVGRTVGSSDAINTVSLVVTNNEATYLLKRPQDFVPAEIPALLQLAEQGDLTELLSPLWPFSRLQRPLPHGVGLSGHPR